MLKRSNIMSSRIDLYVPGEEKGVNNWCAEVMKSTLERTVDAKYHQIRVVTDLDTTLLSDLKSIKAFVIPGGNASEVYFDIIGSNHRLQFTNLLKNVGYYGSCAGAIIASPSHSKLKETDIQLNGFPIGINSYNSSICNCFSLFPGKILAPFIFTDAAKDEFTEKGFVFRDLTATIGSQSRVVQSIHMVGPAFLEPEKIPGATVLATYKDPQNFFMGSYDNRSWKITKSYEDKSLAESVFYKETEDSPGMVLASTHPEIMASDMLRESSKTEFTVRQQNTLHDKMIAGDANRIALFKQNLSLLGVHTI
jgi:glutamine amidotransferase-like uncharacterized protein